MKNQTNQADRRIRPWLAWIRWPVLALTVWVAILWISSYIVGIQRYRSDWSSHGRVTSERARWIISNYGSFGIAWRFQDGALGSPLPPAEYALQTFDSSSSAMNHVHPEGFFAWHWIHLEPTQATTMGSMRTTYGHLYLPYWMPFLAGGLAVSALTVCINRGQTQE